MARWLMKSEPGDYSYEDLERDGGTRWDGIRNASALIHLRNVKPGDELFVYHTGKERRIVGIARATSAAYPDPTQDDERWAVVDVEPVRRLESPVSLAAIKADDAFADFDLVRISRLSVVPVPAKLWNRLLKMGA